MIRVGVIGASGRMGSAVCGAVESDAELELAARVGKEDALDVLVDHRVDVAVEFTTPDSVMANAAWCLGNGIHTVVGATGLDDDNLEELEELCRERGVNLFFAPNFAVGAVLMMRFASEAARYFDLAEIVERHHENKLDAPSGTALRTAELMIEARGKAWGAVAEGRGSVTGRGADVGGVRVHSLRVPGSVAHQEVILGSTGQTLTIRHDSIDRSSFMPGVVLAVKKVATLDGLVVGLEHLLDS